MKNSFVKVKKAFDSFRKEKKMKEMIRSDQYRPYYQKYQQLPKH